MTKDDSAPADTTIMGIVHDALRRDLDRLHRTLTMDMVDSTDDARREAIAAHVEWMMEFLHHHHQGEDEGLWPLLLDRAPQARALLERMEADHRRVVPAMADVTASAHRYRTEGAEPARLGLVNALDDLSESLLPHLRGEEDEAMPLVSANLTQGEWRDWDQTYNIKGKPLSRLGLEAHWTMDGLDRDRYQVLVHLVPAPVRVILVKGFAKRYRAACALRWGADVAVVPLAS
jgi:iron-sulfur cluster repair protein YtfE (RIC family)